VTATAKSIKVLSIDGGGIRGIIPAVILSELRNRLKADLHTVFDLIGGTSTGGIIALGIGTACNDDAPYTPEHLIELYVQNGPAIFKKNLLTWLTQTIRPKYSPIALEHILAEFFGEADFASALTPLLISSYDLQGQLPFFFKSHRIASDPSYNWPVAQIARATSAAPTFFPPLHLSRPQESQNYALADGGVFVSNPSMAAYSESRSLYPNVTNIVVVSVGTGDRKDCITYSASRKWGLLNWAEQITSVFMDSVSEAVDYELSYLPGCTYARLQLPNLAPASPDMDDVSAANLMNLQIAARKFIAANSGYLDRICDLLSEGRGSDMPGIGLSALARRAS
jgi:uncharacterized protein